MGMTVAGMAMASELRKCCHMSGESLVDDENVSR